MLSVLFASLNGENPKWALGSGGQCSTANSMNLCVIIIAVAVAVDSKTRKKAPLNVSEYKRMMSNYFSVGSDARVGLGFDKKRTTSKCCNKCCYGCEGFKKLWCCSKTLKVKQMVNCVYSTDQEGNNKIVFAASRQMDSDTYLSGDPITLVLTNINSYMGGRLNVWEEGKN